MKITKKKITAADAIMAAGEDMDFATEDAISDAVEDVADQIDDMQDTMDEVEEDDEDIEIDNNIENHYIAVCDSCHGFFVSALKESDQEVTSIQGICPICHKESEQYLDYIIKKV